MSNKKPMILLSKGDFIGSGGLDSEQESLLFHVIVDTPTNSFDRALLLAAFMPRFHGVQIQIRGRGKKVVTVREAQEYLIDYHTKYIQKGNENGSQSRKGLSHREARHKTYSRGF